MATSDSSRLLKQLVRKRGALTCRLTYLKKFVNAIENTEISVYQKQELKIYLKAIHNLKADLDNIQSKMDKIQCTPSDMKKHLVWRENFEPDYNFTLAMAECLLAYEETNEPPAENNSMVQSPTNVLYGELSEFLVISKKISKSPATSNSMKKSPISITCFNGSHEDWLEFRNNFSSLVHNNKTITKNDKFRYLRYFLTGNARAIIDSVKFTAVNYDGAWELLLKHFDNPTWSRQQHLKSIFSIQPVTKDCPLRLRKFIDTILNSLKALKLLGEPTEYWDSIVIYTIETKLSHACKRDWDLFKNYLFKGSHARMNIKLDVLIQFLNNRIDTLQQRTYDSTSSSS